MDSTNKTTCVKTGPELVRMDLINCDQSTQTRAIIDETVVKEYREAIARGDKLPPLDLFYDRQQSEYYVGDGWHRHQAFLERGAEEVEANVKAGGERAALKFALSANDRHGLRRTRADKRRAIEVALSDEEWGKLSTRQLAELCHVSRQLVESIRTEFEPESQVVNFTTCEDGQPAKKLRPRVGKDGKPYRPKARQEKPSAEPTDFDPSNLPPSPKPGTEKVKPGLRKEAKAVWGRFVRLCDDIGCNKLVASEVASISTKMKEIWGAGLK